MFNVKIIPVSNTEMKDCNCQLAEIPKPGETVILDEKRLLVYHRDLLPCGDSDRVAAIIFVRNLFEQESGGLPKLAR